MNLQVQLVKAFTKDKGKGNSAGVVLDDGLSKEQMQEIASEVGCPATVFVDQRDYNARFFSTVKESPLCVHAALAAVYVLAQGNSLNIKLNTKAGIFPITVDDEGLISMEMAEAEYSDYLINRAEVVKILQIEESDLGDYNPQIVSAGKPKLVVPIKSLDKLLAIDPDLDEMKKYCEKSGAQGFFLFSFDAGNRDLDYYARHFNPLTLEEKDPICGVGSAALGAYLKEQGLLPKQQFTVQMGYTMDTDGYVIVDVAERIKVGGHCVSFGEKILSIRDN